MIKTIRFALVTALFTASSFASVVSVLTPGGLNANDSVNWGQLGGDLTVVSSPFAANSVLGNLVAVTNGNNDLWVIKQGDTWNGNFNPNDMLLYNQAAGPVEIDFLAPVMSVGARFQSIDFGPYSIFITAFNSSNTLLGSATTTGTSNGAADGSAAFLGVLSSSADIASIFVNVQVAGNDNAFALGSLSIAEATTSAPEPSTMFLCVGGVLACVARKFRTTRS
jgi:hypothetical protein